MTFSRAARILWAVFGALPMAAVATTPVTGTVAWSDATGHTGQLPFQGTIDGNAVSGALNAPFVELRVAGTLGENGQAAGSISTTSGEFVGSFTATHDGQVLTGTFAVDAGSPINFATLSDQLPPP